MTKTARQLTIRANAFYLVAAAFGGLCTDIAGSFFARGPQSGLIALAPHASIGFIEAHGLALIFGILLWRAPASRSWHLTATAIHVLLGTSNLVFWPIFVAADLLAVGYLTTSLHWLFALVQLTAAAAAKPDGDEQKGVPELLPVQHLSLKAASRISVRRLARSEK